MEHRALHPVMSASEARERFSEILDRVSIAKERQIIERRGKAKVAVIPIEDLELLEELEDMLDVREALISLKEAEQEGTVSLEELKKELEI